MSQLQQEEPQRASRRPSPSRAVTPQRNKSSRVVNMSITKAKRSVSTTTTMARNKRIADAPNDVQEPWNIDLMRKWLDPRIVVFCSMIFPSMILGIVRFAKTGDMSIFSSLLAYAAAFSGVKDVTVIIDKLKDIFQR